MPADIPVLFFRRCTSPQIIRFAWPHPGVILFSYFIVTLFPPFFNAQCEYILLSTLSVFWGQFRAA